MKKILILLAAYFIFTLQSFAQAPDTLWTKTFGAEDSDYANSIEQTMDNGFIIYGTKNFNHWDYMDAWLVKTNNNGDTLWTKIFENCQPSGAVHQTLDGGYIMTRSKEFEFENGHLLVKINSLGEIDWEKPLAVEWVNSIEKTSDEGYILTGRSDEGVNLIKTDENGDIIWTKSFGRDSVYYNSNAIQTKEGGYALIISGHQYISRLSMFYDMCLIKTDKDGDSLWTKTFNGHASYIQQTYDGGFIIFGIQKEFLGTTEQRTWLIKTDKDGNTIWTKSLLDFYRGQQTNDNGYILVGSAHNDVMVLKLDEFGDSLWCQSYGSEKDESGSIIKPTTDGGYIIIATISSYDYWDSDIWLIKLGSEPTKVKNSSDIISYKYRLLNNYPNPFNPSTTIKYSIPTMDVWNENFRSIQLKIYDILGREVAALVNQKQGPGFYEVTWHASNIPSGVYFYQLRAGDFVETKKMILLR